MLRYTLAFIRYNDEILMINREKSPWQGAWNGVGGKLEAGETPNECVIREVREETGLKIIQPIYRGMVTWNPDEEEAQGMYVFVADIEQKDEMKTPKRTREGILDWKKETWLLSEKNFGTVPTLRYFMKDVLDIGRIRPADYHCTFSGDAVIRSEIRPLPETAAPFSF
ncbi:NUDIX hydrolase [Sporolactobacillus putidus]|uniref:7,8-dihydro-8-oxoguanine triphosphatase n=1 Tax=Sporolactobacillus putidus TaxID=492735 RepID=A0A917VYN9_9BACL|nr:8-oxo-dGTP diphosphatase [Sporolactobacillus putidus]GGL46147.1 7,8-dihydro-8-oxoguanine triphosphatase [Sporolactobacillus putidus]